MVSRRSETVPGEAGRRQADCGWIVALQAQCYGSFHSWYRVDLKHKAVRDHDESPQSNKEQRAKLSRWRGRGHRAAAVRTITPRSGSWTTSQFDEQQAIYGQITGPPALITAK